MITFIRRMVTSKVGAVVAILFLMLMGLAFAVGDVANMNLTGSGVSTGNIAEVGDEDITIVDVRRALDNNLRAAQQQQPGLTMAQFIASGGLDRTVKELVDAAALEQYGRSLGVNIDQASVDALIARDPRFADNTGRFNQATFEATIGQQGLNARQVRDGLAGEFIARQIAAPVAQVPVVPQTMTLAYAALPMERRMAQATFIPSSRFAPTGAPTGEQLSAYYAGQRARYSLPERRTIRYALLDQGAVRSIPAVTDAEIGAEYRANAASFAARETRRLSQVIAGSREAAQRIATAARGGSLAAAAQTAGLQAATLPEATKASLSTATSAAIADATFAGAQGAVIGPMQVPLGWVVIKVDGIERVAARSLAQATPELRARLADRKRREALDDLFNGVQEALNGGASLTEVAQDRGLQMVTTPALLANGADPANPAYRADPLLPALLAPAFQATQGDAAQIIPLQDNQVFALVELADVMPSAPPPLESMRERVIADWRRAEGGKIARDRARAILRAVEGGQSLAAAAAASGVAGSVQTIAGTRIDTMRGDGRIPPEIALLFAMERGSVRTLELPGSAGWMVLKLDTIVRGDPRTQPELLANTERDMTRVLQSEYVAMIVAAARAHAEVRVDDAAIARLRAELTGSSAAAN